MRADARWPSDAGQAMAFVLCLMFTMLLFVGVVVDVGQAANRRIALQYVADTGAYTGASVMAVGHNQLAQWNKFMQYAWAAFTLPGTPIWAAMQIHITECTTADTQETLYYTVMEQFRAVARVENAGYNVLARSEAKSVSEYNAADLFPGETLDYSESVGLTISSSRPVAQMAAIEEVPDGTLPQALPAGLPAITELTYICFSGVHVEQRARKYPVWLRKTPNHVDTFVWIAKAARTRAYLFDSFFGGKLIPEMQAVAVAKPVGGSIEEGRDRYQAKMIPVAAAMTINNLVNSVMPSFVQDTITGQAGVIDDKGYDRGRRIITH